MVALFAIGDTLYHFNGLTLVKAGKRNYKQATEYTDDSGRKWLFNQQTRRWGLHPDSKKQKAAPKSKQKAEAAPTGELKPKPKNSRTPSKAAKIRSKASEFAAEHQMDEQALLDLADFVSGKAGIESADGLTPKAEKPNFNEVRREIRRVAAEHQVSDRDLLDFAEFVNGRPFKPVKTNIKDIRDAVIKDFGYSSLKDLKQDPSFQLYVQGSNLDLSKKESWLKLHRKFVGLPENEKDAIGDTVINGVDVLRNFLPWEVFDLDPQTTTKEQLNSAFRRLALKHHPDHGGNPEVFERLKKMRDSLMPIFEDSTPLKPKAKKNGDAGSDSPSQELKPKAKRRSTKKKDNDTASEPKPKRKKNTMNMKDFISMMNEQPQEEDIPKQDFTSLLNQEYPDDVMEAYRKQYGY